MSNVYSPFLIAQRPVKSDVDVNRCIQGSFLAYLERRAGAGPTSGASDRSQLCGHGYLDLGSDEHD